MQVQRRPGSDLKLENFTKFGAFVITFDRPEILVGTLRLILEQTRPPDLILIVDNGSSVEIKELVEKLSNKIAYHSMQENAGPAGAAAFALKWLVEQGCDWIYWGDEDDPPEFSDALERVLNVAVNAGSTKVAGAGAVGALFDWQKGETMRLPDRVLSGVVAVDTIGGNSQFIISKEAVEAVGVPDSRLFFGFYEPEYCLRLRKAGFELLVDGDLMWKYRNKNRRLNYTRKRALISRYPEDLIWRRYYRTRNYIFAMKNTFQRSDLARREALKSLGRLLFSWLRGPKYGAQFSRLQLRGILDGYFGRMGRTVLPVPKNNHTRSVLDAE